MSKKALVEPNGRIAQIVDVAAMFPVAAGLKWIDVDDTVTTEHRVQNGTTIVPPPARTLAEAKEQALSRITLARDAAMAAGFEFEGHVYHSDKDAIRDVLMALTGAQMATKPVPSSIAWKLKERKGTTTHIALTLPKLGALFEALTGNMLTIYGREETRMAEILRAASVAAADGVVW